MARYHHGNLRASLLAAARLAVEAQGETGLSLRALASTAGVTANAPYRHFATKEALLAAVAAEGFAELTARFAPFVTAPDEARLQGCLEAYLGFAREHPGLYRLMFGRSLDPLSCEPILGEQARACFLALMAVVAQILKRPSDDPKVSQGAAMVWSLSHGAALLDIDRATAFLADQARPTAAGLGRMVMSGLANA